MRALWRRIRDAIGDALGRALGFTRKRGPDDNGPFA